VGLGLIGLNTPCQRCGLSAPIWLSGRISDFLIFKVLSLSGTNPAFWAGFVFFSSKIPAGAGLEFFQPILICLIFLGRQSFLFANPCLYSIFKKFCQ